MDTRSRWFVVGAVVLLASAYVLPLWRVDLHAPQYPEGLGMLIRVNGVEGLKPNDLNSINALNHYIGMKRIEPDAIPELRFMPWILAGLIAGGVAVAGLGRRLPLHLWGGVLGLTLLAGLADYWRWGYDYGHDIDRDHAIIKIPGMTYQPPLIGTKQLLNFKASSWPSSGGIALGLAAGLVAVAIVSTSRSRRARSRAGGRAVDARAVTAAAVAALLTTSACGAPRPRAIVAGEDQCGYCRMEVSDPRFGAEAVLRSGKVHVFDSIDCLASYVRTADADALAGIWVTGADRPGEFVRADSAGFLRGSTLRPPMGPVVAFSSPSAAVEARVRVGGTLVTWDQLLDEARVAAVAGHASATVVPGPARH